MRKQQSGFTLIELIAVLVILGILAATALPKFVDLSDEARTAAIKNIAGTIESSSALNHAIDVAIEAGLSTDTLVTIANCSDVGDLFEGGMPEGYAVTAGVIVDKETATCTITHTSSALTDTALVIGAAP